MCALQSEEMLVDGKLIEKRRDISLLQNFQSIVLLSPAVLQAESGELALRSELDIKNN